MNGILLIYSVTTENGYATIGQQYSYPGFVPTGSSTYTYSITVDQSNPLSGTLYQTSSPYSSSKVIYASDTLGLSAGVYLTFTQTVNGSTWSYNLSI